MSAIRRTGTEPTWTSDRDPTASWDEARQRLTAAEASKSSTSLATPSRGPSTAMGVATRHRLDGIGARGEWRLRVPWAAYAAAAWAILFAAQSFYGAAGGTFGLATFGREIERQARERESGFITLVWITGGLKLGVGILALALAGRWGRALPRRLLRGVAWATSGFLLIYGTANLVQHGLMQAGALDIPSGLGHTGLSGHLFLWDPWWMLGGILFAMATWRHRQKATATASPHLE